MHTVQGTQAHSRQTTTKDIYSRPGCVRQPVCSGIPFQTGPSQQAQPQRRHALLQRCHSLLVRQSATGSDSATQQQQQEFGQDQLQSRPRVLQLPEQDRQSHTSYSSSSSSDWDEFSLSAAGNGGAADASSRGFFLPADASPAQVTWSLSHADSIQQLQAAVSLYAPNFNCIHISAAFVRLQRLWPSSGGSNNSSSSSSSSLSESPSSTASAAAHEDAWLVQPSSSTSSTSSSSRSDLSAARQLLSRLQSLALTVPRIDSRFVVNVLYSSAVLLSVHGEAGAYSAALVNRLCAAAYSLTNSMPPQELATLAWALARLAVVPAPALLRRLVSNVLVQLGRFSPQDLLMTLSALPALHQTPGLVAPYSTVHKLAAAVGRVLPVASAHEAAALLAALGGVRWRAPSAWLQAYWAAVAHKVQDMGWQQLAMTGWALGQLSPLAAAPPAAWLEAWEAALSQHLHRAAADTAGPSNGSHSSSISWPGRQQVPAVELCMVLYGWSKALPQQAPSEPLQQLVLSVTQEALSSSSISSLSLKQQRQVKAQQAQQQQQQRRQQPPQQEPQQLPLAWQQQLQLHTELHTALQQQHQQPHQVDVPDNSSSSSSSRPGLSPRLLAELVSTMARWQLLPPRQWLLDFLTASQQQLQLGGYSIRDLSSTLWGLATLGVKPNTHWLDLAAAAAGQQMQRQAQAVLQLQQQRQNQQQQQQRAVERSTSLGVGTTGSPSLQNQASLGVVQQPGSSSRQQQQFAAVPKQLAVLLWSLQRLQYRPASGFWQQYWDVSTPLLAQHYTARDLAMTLDAVVQHQQQPPQPWINAALAAALSVHKREPKAARDPPKQQQQQLQLQQSSWRQPPSSSSSSRDQHQQQQEQPAGRQLQHQHQHQQRQFTQLLLSTLSSFVRLRVSPGHQWCGCVLDRPVRPLALTLTAQDMCQLLWALGSCGYSPTGRALPAWLHTHVERLLWPTASSSSSLFPGISLESAVQLFVGLRRSKVVLSGQWLAALLDASEASAATLPLQVMAQLVAYVASTSISPPPSWTAAVLAALPNTLAAQQQHEAAGEQQRAAVWLLILLVGLWDMRVALQPHEAQQLQAAVDTVMPHAPARVGHRLQRCLSRLVKVPRH